MSAVLRVLLIAVPIAVACGLLSSESRAQGFFQGLFGFSNPQRPGQAARPATLSPPSDLRYRAPVAPLVRQPPDTQRDPDPVASSSGRYRTMCVRLCDGYYFPVSAAVSRSTFNRDANLCRASCGSEARLFFHASSSGDAGTMVDLAGRAYSRLPNAFRYRKSLVDGCKCKPEPWAETELARHRRYAAEASTRPLAAQALASLAATPPASTTDASQDSPTPAITPAPLAASAVDEPAKPTAPAAKEIVAALPSRTGQKPSQSAAKSRNGSSGLSKADRAPPLKPAAQVALATPKPRAASRPPHAAPVGLGAKSLRWPGD